MLKIEGKIMSIKNKQLPQTYHSAYCAENAGYAAELAMLKIKVDDEPEKVSPNINLVNCEELEYNFYCAKAERECNGENFDHNAQNKLKAEILRSYLYEHNLVDANLDDVLKHGTSNHKPEEFDAILTYKYDSARSNTDCMRKIFGIGNAQMIFMENKESYAEKFYSMAMTGMSKNVQDRLISSGLNIPLLLKERGRLHETMHTMGTGDERKCDTFAMLKLLKDHQAPIIYDLFANSRINGMMYPLAICHQNFDKATQNNWDTYLMTNTLKKLKAIAYNPEELAKLKRLDDRALIQMTIELCAQEERTPKENEQLKAQIGSNGDKPLSREQLLSCTVFQDMMELSGCQTPQEQQRFIEERLLPGVVKSIKMDVFKRFSANNVPLKEINQAKEQAIKQQYQAVGATYIPTKAKHQPLAPKTDALYYFPAVQMVDDLKAENPQLSGRELQSALCKEVIIMSMERMGRVCEEYSKHPEYCFNLEKQRELTAQINSCYQCCDNAAKISHGLLKNYHSQKIKKQRGLQHPPLVAVKTSRIYFPQTEKGIQR